MKKTLTVFVVFTALLVFTACASSSGQAGLTGKVWVVTALSGKPPVPTTAITAHFNADGSLSESAGCNVYNGKYTVSGDQIKISAPLATTMKACPDPVMAQESAYLKALGDAKTYKLQGDQLSLIDGNNTELVVYKVQSQDLSGTAWDVIGYNNGKQAVTSVLAGTTLTANFGKDGNLTGNAGCNDYNGPYKTTGDTIKIGPLGATRKACADPAGIMDQEAQFMAALDSAATYEVEGTKLQLRTKDGALAVDLVRK
jgi:heat shock protein HslJ